jgi:hypothetical protein
MWDKLKDKTPIYNGDVIRTSDGSSVSIVFTGSDKLDLGPNSLVQINWTPVSGVEAKVSSGTVSGSSASGKTMTINAGKKKITIKSGASVKTQVQKTGEVKVAVTKGQAAVSNTTGGGSRETVKAGQQVSVSNTQQVSKPSPITPPPPPPPPPPPQALVAPSSLRPAAGFVLDNRALEKSLALEVSWNSVPHAAGYTLRLWTNSRDKPLIVQNGLKAQKWDIPNLFTLLGIGSQAPSAPIVVRWEVSAEANPAQTQFANGAAASSSFVLQLQAPKSTSITGIQTQEDTQ